MFLYFICTFFFYCNAWQQPELLKLKEETSRINSKIKRTRKELDKKIEQRRKHGQYIKELQKGIQDLNAKLDDLHEKGRDSGEKLQLDDQALREYCRM